ncbi:NAD-dependent epimerase/dehydratase [Nitzschia inconspicua]|uniref:NAD-dependent epimerase/dehydratase n=1 Tax=Nitzschia inconspicua TaxID=303405 RepID=A0A9K3LJX5_9STRA|nr:NAD-dependent epimerase/dehydratase [Nitzschia inconspicua]
MKIFITILAVLGIFQADAFLPTIKSGTKFIPTTVGGGSSVSPSSFQVSSSAVTLRSSTTDDSASEEKQAAAFPTPTNQIVQKVAVAGATGRTGKLVVEELLKRNVQVVAMVRSLETAAEKLVNVTSNSNLEIQQCDLTNENALSKALQGCDAAVWCATGFSDAPSTSLLEKAKRLLKIVVAPKQSIDAVGVPAMANILLSQVQKTSSSYPKLVMLSSAGVTRPSWSDAKKQKLAGCADIPIVRLNPFGILDVKAESEQKLRDSGVNYCIVRPCGLNDNWPAGARPVFSQGDVAVGRINRQDVAKVLCDVLTLEEACDKTFEVVGLAGYPPPLEIAPALKRLKTDAQGISEAESEAMYAIMQQLLPGEKQDAAALAMGQTYEQLDKGETGRLGERGTENAEAAAPKPTNV